MEHVELVVLPVAVLGRDGRGGGDAPVIVPIVVPVAVSPVPAIAAAVVPVVITAAVIPGGQRDLAGLDGDGRGVAEDSARGHEEKEVGAHCKLQ